MLIVDLPVDFFERHTRSRRAGQRVIWVRPECRPDLGDAFLDMRRRGLSITIAGTEGARLLPELTQAPSDHVVIKKRYSDFHGTDLDERLSSLGARSLVIGGINTHACVRTTVVDAYQREYDMTLSAECIASCDAGQHDVTVRALSAQIPRLESNAEIFARLFASESYRPASRSRNLASALSMYRR